MLRGNPIFACHCQKIVSTILKIFNVKKPISKQHNKLKIILLKHSLKLMDFGAKLTLINRIETSLVS